MPCVLLAAILPFACTTKFEEEDVSEEDPGETSPDALEDVTEFADDARPDVVDVPDTEAETTCGNGTPDAGEECDDGNALGWDGCENDCTWTCRIDDECADGQVCNGQEFCEPVGHTCDRTAPPAEGTPCVGPGENYCKLSSCDASQACVPGIDDLPNLHHVIQIAAGYIHTCALIDGGGVKCWGNNQYGQVGDGSRFDRSAPVDVAGLAWGVELLVAGGLHTCAVMGGGMSMKCWGRDAEGQLGNNTTVGSSRPVDVSGLTSGVTDIAAGRTHTCAVMDDGAVMCWGSNFSGQLGDGSNFGRLAPVNVGDASGAEEVTAGGVRGDGDTPMGHTCIRGAAGRALCWGYNIHGQLGNNNIFSSNTPGDVQGLASGVAQISAGGTHTCARLNDSSLRCWGDNTFGQVGDDTNIDRLVPVEVALNVMAVSLGQFHTCALIDGGGVECWGWNTSGQLGDGTTDVRRVPTSVRCN